MAGTYPSMPRSLALRSAALLPLVSILALGACLEVEDPAAEERLAWREGPGDVFPPPYTVPGRWTLDEPVCGVTPDPAGGGIPQQLGIDPPTPPQEYAAPTCSPAQALANECRIVSNAGELQAAVLFDPGHPMDIILEDGYYLGSGLDDVVVDPTNAPYLSLGRAHRLWAENSGKAILTFGVVAGGNYCNPAHAAKFDGSEFHGLVFDITNADYAYQANASSPTVALANWGHSRGMKVQDCWFRGWEVVERAIAVSRPDGLVVERVEMLNFERFGISVELGWPAAGGCAGPPPDVAADPAQLRDLAVHGIADPAWSSQGAHLDCGDDPPVGAYCPGTQEHGIWIGEPTTLERARIRNVAWSGLIVAEPNGPLTGVTLRDIDVDHQGSNEDGWGAGIGFERGNDGTLLEQFCVGPDVRRGVHSEWDHGGDMLSNIGMTIADGWSRARFVGISLDGGTQDVSIDNVNIDEACLTPLYMDSNSDILPYTDCCTTTNWTAFDITGSTSSCDVLLSNMPSVAQALTTPRCAMLLSTPPLDPTNDCRALPLANIPCANNGGMDACP